MYQTNNTIDIEVKSNIEYYIARIGYGKYFIDEIYRIADGTSVQKSTNCISMAKRFKNVIELKNRMVDEGLECKEILIKYREKTNSVRYKFKESKIFHS